MRGKLPAIILTFLVITFLYVQCVAAGAAAVIGFLSSVATLEQFIEVMYGHVFKSPERVNQGGLLVKHMNDDVQYLLSNLSAAVQEVPSVIAHIENRRQLRLHIENIGDQFNTAARMQTSIEKNGWDKDDIYTNFRDKFEHMIDNDIAKIKSTLIHGTTSVLAPSLIEGMRLYENVCKTNRSHLQSLDILLTQFFTATTLYYITKNKMFDFVQHLIKDPHHFDITRKNLRDQIRDDYYDVVREFKKNMATASREVRKCDGPKTNRYENKPDGPYYELMAFTQYIMNEELYYDESSECAYVNCPTLSNKKVDKCRSDDHDHFGWCSKTRKCPSELIYCDYLHERPQYSSLICLNVSPETGHKARPLNVQFICEIIDKNDSNARNRYTSFLREDLFKYFQCYYGTSHSVKDLQYNGKFSSRAGWQSPSQCRYCQCICRENIYYISTDIAGIPDGLDHMVVTGARIVVEDNTIYIQVQLRQLLPQGNINATTVHDWQKIKKNGPREEISWGGIRSIDLTTTMLPHDEVITGMKFKLSPINKDRVYLSLYSCKFNIRTGFLYRCKEQPYNKNPQEQLNLNDADVPTNSIRMNEPDSNEDQYITFTTTSMEKDGGQTTIPFIDTQSITTTPLSPFSGAGMYHRGEKNYGGFLGLRLYTYDLGKYINENTVVPPLEEV